MSLWILLVILAQFLTAVIVVVDKHLLVSENGLKKPAVYAFYVSLLSGVAVILLPFGVVGLPNMALITLSLIATVSFLASILLLFTALKRLQASDVAPVLGATSAISTALLAYFFLATDLPPAFIPAFVLMTLGTFLIYCFCFSWRFFLLVVLSGICFGISSFLLKLMFTEASFYDVFFWSRMANVLGAFALLLIPANFYAIHESLSRTKKDASAPQPRSYTPYLVIGNKTLGGVAFLLTAIAISMGSVSIVGAMAGLNLVFLLIFPLFLGARFRYLFWDDPSSRAFKLKLIGTALIVLGLATLFIV